MHDGLVLNETSSVLDNQLPLRTVASFLVELIQLLNNLIRIVKMLHEERLKGHFSKDCPTRPKERMRAMDDDQGEDVAETVQPDIEDEYGAPEGDGLAEPLEEDEYDLYNQEYDGDQYDDGEPDSDDRIGLMHYEDDEANIADFILSDDGESPYESPS
ncbi:hypothetical protein GLOTRDRAFT_134560 [Gloeophyllum trabeum ATCC 11539]|uniref:Uncharacterized protein n=1 Tax=Gloeophyllum trabeum (strain ATCC 11539 / FP-39264 / Madison 617) TaxID=670483 RepID=S7PPN6_GLOTA|nr:uncharacterized protein GLOTRDRAFT_134560 [Gloeophyllum trabeum ATCC 11539]EPQ49831.1 hypothetical protein GLOTRDRAFT_134560 [Gloeophyllum trabeum ATCC 11539]